MVCSTFNGFGQGATSYTLAIGVYSDRIEISDNLFENFGRRAFGISVGSTSSKPNSKGAWIHHNTLRNSAPYNGQQGGPAIALGIGGPTGNPSTEAVIEYNYIHNWGQDPEVIELKASDNQIRYNLALNNGEAHLSNRIGHNNTYYGNWVEGSRFGWRVSGTGNRFHYNYVKSTGAAGTLALVWFGQTAKESRAYNNTVSCNIFDGYQYWAANIVQGGALLSPPTSNTITENEFPGLSSLTASNFANPHRQVDHATYSAANSTTMNNEGRAVQAGYSCASAGAVANPPSWWAAVSN